MDLALAGGIAKIYFARYYFSGKGGEKKRILQFCWPRWEREERERRAVLLWEEKV